MVETDAAGATRHQEQQTAGDRQVLHEHDLLLPLVIFAELGGGLAIVFGLLTRIAAGGLAVFSIDAAVQAASLSMRECAASSASRRVDSSRAMPSA